MTITLTPGVPSAPISTTAGQSVNLQIVSGTNLLLLAEGSADGGTTWSALKATNPLSRGQSDNFLVQAHTLVRITMTNASGNGSVEIDPFSANAAPGDNPNPGTVLRLSPWSGSTAQLAVGTSQVQTAALSAGTYLVWMTPASLADPASIWLDTGATPTVTATSGVELFASNQISIVLASNEKIAAIRPAGSPTSSLNYRRVN